MGEPPPAARSDTHTTSTTTQTHRGTTHKAALRSRCVCVSINATAPRVAQRRVAPSLDRLVSSRHRDDVSRSKRQSSEV